MRGSSVTALDEAVGDVTALDEAVGASSMGGQSGAPGEQLFGLALQPPHSAWTLPLSSAHGLAHHASQPTMKRVFPRGPAGEAVHGGGRAVPGRESELTLFR